MKQYVFDQLREADYEGVLNYLERNAIKTAIGGVYRVEIPREHYTPAQVEHVGDCGPYYFAVSLDLNKVAFELLIRSQERLRCSCIAYATDRQRDYILNYADDMLEQLDIRI